MRYYPLFIDISGRNVLVVGGGAVAGRKIQRLLECGASVTIIAPTVTEYLESLEAAGQITVLRRGYADGDVEGYTLVIAATDREDLNARIYGEASRRNILINTADKPEEGSFITPAVVERGDFICAFSASGESPLFLKELKDYFERKLYSELNDDIAELSALRREILSRPDISREEKASELKNRIQPKIDNMIQKIERQ